MLDTREIKKVLVVFLSIAVVLGGFVGIRSLMNNDKKEQEVQVNDNDKETDEKEETEDVTFGDFIISVLVLGTIGGAGGALAYFTNRPKK